jgi:hypothetical protein
MGYAMTQWSEDISRGSAGVHVKKLSAGVCLEVFFSSYFRNLTEKSIRREFFKNGRGISETGTHGQTCH